LKAEARPDAAPAIIKADLFCISENFQCFVNSEKIDPEIRIPIVSSYLPVVHGISMIIGEVNL
jgi:hypothetical protein